MAKADGEALALESASRETSESGGRVVVPPPLVYSSRAQMLRKRTGLSWSCSTMGNFGGWAA